MHLCERKASLLFRTEHSIYGELHDNSNMVRKMIQHIFLFLEFWGLFQSELEFEHKIHQ